MAEIYNLQEVKFEERDSWIWEVNVREQRHLKRSYREGRSKDIAHSQLHVI